MTRPISRALAPLVLLAFVLGLAGVPLALAANGSVHGRIAVDGGPLPSGSVVRATPLTGGGAMTTSVATDGTFLLQEVPEGAYLFEVVGPGGTVMGSIKTLVPPSPLQLNMRARVPTGPAAAPPALPRATPAAPATPVVPGSPTAPPPAAPAPASPPTPVAPTPRTVEAPPPRPAPVPTSRARTHGAVSNKKKWALVASIVGGLGAGIAIGNSGNNNASPSQP